VANLGLAVIAVEMPLPPAHHKSDIATFAQKLSLGWLPSEFETRGIERLAHAGANLVEADEWFGSEYDRIGGHELHPAVYAALGGGFGEGVLGVDQDFGVAVGGEAESGRQQKKRQPTDE
jgi:hypothetical protein